MTAVARDRTDELLALELFELEGLSVVAYNILCRMGVETLGELRRVTIFELRDAIERLLPVRGYSGVRFNAAGAVRDVAAAQRELEELLS